MTPGAKFIGRDLSLVTLAYTALTVMMTWPIASHLFDAVAGFDGRDSFQWVWFNWWGVKSLLALQSSPAQVDWLYYPQGAYHPILLATLFVPLVALPLTLVGGVNFAYNVMFLTSFILGGTLTYLLAFSITHQRLAAFVAGLIFIFAPHRMGHATAGHLLLITTWSLPLYALAVINLLRHPSWRWAATGGIALTALTLTQPIHLAYFALPFTVVYGGVTLLTHRGMNTLKSAWPYVGSMVLLAALLLLPFFGSLLGATLHGEQDFFTNVGIEEHSTDLMAFLLPSPYHPLWYREQSPPALLSQLVGSPREMEERLAYLGVLPLGLAVWAMVRRPREGLAWLILTLLAAILAMGPYLKIFDRNTGVLLPYYWLMDLPFLSWSRTPGRINETVALGLAMLAALGLSDVLSHRRTRAQRTMVTTVVVLFVILEYWVIFPFPMDFRPISGYYRALAREALEGGVLEMPVSGSRRATNYALYYQTIHQHPLAGGYIERDPPGTVELKEFLNQLLSPLPTQTVFTPPNEAERLAILADMKIKRVIAHPSLMTDRAAQATRVYLPLLLGASIFADEDTWVYPVQSEVDSHLSAWQLLPDQEGWEVVREGTALRLKKTGYLFIYAAEVGPAQLQFQLDSPARPTQLTWRFNDSSTQTYLIEGKADLAITSLSLRQGLNYFRLSTEPAQELEFLVLSVQVENELNDAEKAGQ
jgi:hypothetical protein